MASGVDTTRSPAVELYIRAMDALDPEQRAFSDDAGERLANGLVLLREAADAGAVDWGIDWEKAGRDGQLEGPGWLADPVEFSPKLRRVAQELLRVQEEKMGAGNFEGLAGELVDLVAMGRELPAGRMAQDWLSGQWIERKVNELVAAHAVDLPEEVLLEFLRKKQNLPDPIRAATFLEFEEAVIRGDLWRTLMGAGPVTGGLSGEGGTDPAIGSFADRIRMSSMVTMGGEILSIGFEDADSGRSFTLRPGEIRQGFELISVDVGAMKALIRQGNRLAVVELRRRTIVALDLAAGWRRIIEEFPDFDRFLTAANGDQVTAFQALLEEFEEVYERFRPLMSLPYEDTPDFDELEGMPLLTETIHFGYGRMRQVEFEFAARSELLTALTAHLQDREAPLPLSEITPEPIRMEQREGQLVFISPVNDGVEPITLEVQMTENSSRP